MLPLVIVAAGVAIGCGATVVASDVGAHAVGVIPGTNVAPLCCRRHLWFPWPQWQPFQIGAVLAMFPPSVLIASFFSCGCLYD